MSDPGHGSSIPPGQSQHSGYQYPSVTPPGQFGAPPGEFGSPPGQFGPARWQEQTAPKQPLATRLASTLDSWQKVVLACTALIVAIGGLGAAVEATHSKNSAIGAPQGGSTAGSSGIQTTAPAQSSSTAGSSGIQIPAQPTARPAGCQQGLEAIATFGQTAGSTPTSMQNAAQRALGTIGAISDASGPVALDLQFLDNDFLKLFDAAFEQNMSGLSLQDRNAAAIKQDSSAFSTELDQINADSQLLTKDCNTR